MTLVRVALDVPIDELFDYHLRDGHSAEVGQRVIVPFGRGRRAGVVLDVGGESRLEAHRLKAVDSVLHEEPLLDGDVIDLARFCAGYYHHPIGQVVLAALPPRLREPAKVGAKDDRPVALTSAGREKWVQLPERNVAQRALLEFVASREGATPSEIRAALPRSAPWLRKFTEQGLIAAAVQTIPSPEPDLASGIPELTAHQIDAVAAIREGLGQYNVFLLLGITGSGKTEVYLQVIADVVRAGRQVLMLVPEINLTPQLEARVNARFPGVPVASLHSDLAEGERLARWRAAQSGEARIIMGTRLAVFTPLPNLGLIVVDEEHDESFKQDEGLRYHARDLAIVRARQRAVPVLLGSATPSLESYARALSGRYRLLGLPLRAAARLPHIRCIDTRHLKLTEGLSGPLMEALAQRLARGEQSLIFINRRGYSPALLCYACGWIAQCERCSARLVYHARGAQLRCHYCGHQEPVPDTCAHCGNLDLKPRGHGTQRLEGELARAFPGARIARVDRDTTQRKHAFAALRELVHSQKIDILVGTQMLAKGHDFPNLTLVGIVNADATLFSTDFRAAERMFCLLTQVAGRSGRARIQGEVMIQTDFPGHPVYAAVEKQDYAGFADSLLRERRQLGFPPYAFQALLRAEANERARVDDFLAQAARACLEVAAQIEVFDPVPASMARVAGRERGQLLVQSTSRVALQDCLAKWRRWLVAHGGNRVRWTLDVDPRNI